MSTATEPRKRDSAATRQALLDAARELFGARGYDDTTLREIGERAGVDAALIARYFGNKAALYIAVVSSESMPYQATEIRASIDEAISLLLERTDTRGVGPITQALLGTDVDPEIRQAAAEQLDRRLISRLIGQMADDLEPDARIRAELAVSALLAVLFLRGHGTLGHLASASPDQVHGFLATMLRSILVPDGASS